MTEPRRKRSIRSRFLRLFASLVIVAAVCSYFALDWLEAYAKQRIASELSSLANSSVEISRISLKRDGVSLHGVELSPISSTEDAAALSFDHADIQVPLWEAMQGSINLERIVVTRPRLRLRFSESGELQTRFEISPTPGRAELGQIVLNNASLDIDQAGRPPLTISGVDVQAQVDDEQLSFAGDAREVLGATWSFNGTTGLNGIAGNATFATKEFSVSQQLIENLPVINIKTRRISNGKAAAAIHGNIEWQSTTLKPRITVRPQFARATIDGQLVSIDIEDGEVVLDGAQLIIESMSGLANQAEFNASCNYNFEAEQGSAQVEFTGLSLDSIGQMNETYGVSATGDLDGKANVELTRQNDRYHVDGGLELTSENIALLDLQSNTFHFTANMQADVADQEPQFENVNGMARVDVLFPSMTAEEIVDAAQKIQSKQPSDRTLTIDKTMLRRIRAFSKRVPSDSRIGVEAVCEISLDALLQKRPINQVRGQLEIDLQDFAVEDVSIDAPNRIQVRLSDGNIDVLPAAFIIDSPRTKSGAKIVAKATSQLTPAGSIRFAAKARRLAVADAHAIANSLTTAFDLGELPPLHTSLTSTVVDLSAIGDVPTDELTKKSSWRFKGNLKSPRWEFEGIEVNDLTSDFRFASSLLTFTNSTANVVGQPVRAQGRIRVQKPFGFIAMARADNFNVSSIVSPLQTKQLELTGNASIAGTVKGTLQPLNIVGKGKGAIDDASVDVFDVDSVDFAWELDEEKLALREVNVALLDHKVQAEASYPFTPNVPSTIRGQLDQLDIAKLEPLLHRLMPSTRKHAVSVAGAGDLQFSIENWHLPESIAGSAKLNVNRLVLNTFDLANLEGHVDLKPTQLDIKANVATLQGRVAVSSHADFEDLTQLGTNSAEWKGEVEAERLSIEQLTRLLPKQTSRPMSGFIDAKLEITRDATGRPLLQGPVKLDALRWNQHQVSRLVHANARLTPESINLTRLNGEFAGGRVRGSTRIERNGRGIYDFTIDQVDTSDALRIFGSTSDLVSGKLNGQVQGTIGGRVNGRGKLELGRGEISRIPITKLRFPFEAVYSPGRNELRVRAPKIEAIAAGGRVSGRCNALLGHRLDLDASITGERLEIKRLMGSFRNGGGRVSGSANVIGRNVRSLNDLRGRFEIDLSQIQPFQFPVMRQVGRFLDPIQPSASFDSGTAQGRIAGGAIHLERTTIEGGVARLFLEGRATFAGRLDLDVTAQTGDLNTATAAVSGLARTSVSMVAPMPIEALAQINEYLANRLIFIHVGGNVARPVIRIQPARQLQREAILFFIRQATRAAIN